MKLPNCLKIICSFFAIIGIIGLIYGYYSNQALNGLNVLLTSLTLTALAVYAYHTYLIAKDAYTASASLVLQPFPNDPYHIAFIIQNHS